MTSLLIDMDTPVWKILARKEGEPGVPFLDACMYTDRMIEGYIKEMEKYFPITSVTLFITPDDRSNFRYNLEAEQEYKGNRKLQKKPEGFLQLKEYIRQRPNCITMQGLEADDLIAIEATQGAGDSCIIGIDKDYRQLGSVYLWGTDPKVLPEFSNDFGYLTKFIPRVGDIKIYGRGLKWFYYQLLVGDAADHIRGAKGIGPIKAFKLLVDCISEMEMWNVVCACYQEQGVIRAIQNARLLWLKRKLNEPLWEPPTCRK